tara:strand:+ start:111 stop:503 length:393 start_codon:yes stop_codon:yes gene_type:complete
MSVIRAFNDHFEEFVTDVERVFPDDIEIATAHTAIKSLRKSNPKLILVTFRDTVVNPYRSQIDSGDISFFIQKDYNADLNEFGCSTSDSSGILSKIETLREPIGRMGKDDRQKVITYLQNLAKICDLYKQ